MPSYKSDHSGVILGSFQDALWDTKDFHVAKNCCTSSNIVKFCLYNHVQLIMSEPPTLTLEQFRKAIKDVLQFELESKKEQQRHFILKLVETNNELFDELNAEATSPEDGKLYAETIEENKMSLLEQISRVESINLELVERGLMSSEDKSKEEQKLLDEINNTDKSTQKAEPKIVEDEKEGGIML